MLDLKQYIEEAISSGKNKIVIDYRTQLEDFIDLLDRLGYKGNSMTTPEKWNMEEIAPTVINKPGDKYYNVQHIRGGFHRVVLYNGVDNETVFEVNFTEHGKGGICGLHRCSVHQMNSVKVAFGDSEVDELIDYINEGK